MRKKTGLIFGLILLCALLGACSPGLCTVRLDACGGEAVSPAVTVEKGNRLDAMPAAKRDGWFFGGWYTAETGGSAWKFDKDTVDADMTLYAHWLAEGVTVRFELCLPESVPDHSPAPAPELLAKGAYAAVPVDPTAEGYLFESWTDKDGLPWDFRSPVNGNLTLYADWRLSRSVFFYDGADGKELLPPAVYGKGTALGRLPGVSRAGYAFTGWATDPEGDVPFVPGRVLDDDLILFAQWIRETDESFFKIVSGDLGLNADFAGETLIFPKKVQGKSYNAIVLTDAFAQAKPKWPTVKTVVLPASLKSVPDLTFFSNLERIVVDRNNYVLFGFDGCLYSRLNGETVLEVFPAGRRGYAEISPLTERIASNGVFFLRGEYSETYSRFYVDSGRRLIVEDEYYDGYASAQPFWVSYLMRKSDYSASDGFLIDSEGCLSLYWGQEESVTPPAAVKRLGRGCMPSYVTQLVVPAGVEFTEKIFLSGPPKKIYFMGQTLPYGNLWYGDSVETDLYFSCPPPEYTWNPPSGVVIHGTEENDKAWFDWFVNNAPTGARPGESWNGEAPDA